jgi:acetyl-CoA carboxylase carboxyl transferase subunit beta
MDNIPEGLMTKCPRCGTLLVTKDWERDLKVCSQCGYHARLSAQERIALLLDPGTFQEWDADLTPADPLGFPSYEAKRTQSQQKTALNDSLVCGAGQLSGRDVALSVADFSFMGGSMGSIFGEKVTRTFERALEQQRPAIICVPSGGARMQEGLLSLMQMAKTSAAVARLNKSRVPYIVVLADPSTGGVQASFVSLGDVTLAEPGALIGFTGARVIEQNLHIKLPKDFQSAEFQKAHGQIDDIVPRARLKDTIALILNLLLD